VKPKQVAAPEPAVAAGEDPGAERKKNKKGGNRGVEIEGAADIGVLQFFSTSVDEPQGDLEFLEECVEAMNAAPVPGAEGMLGSW